jgi:hypothetical protein
MLVAQLARQRLGGARRPLLRRMLVHPHHCENVPVRKTYTKDCQWIADLLQRGLWKGRFVPPTPPKIYATRRVTEQRCAKPESGSEPYPKSVGTGQREVEFGSHEHWRYRVATCWRRLLLARTISSNWGNWCEDAKSKQLQQALERRVREHRRFLLGGYLHGWRL